MLLSYDRLPVMLQASELQIQCEMAYIADLPRCLGDYRSCLWFATSRFEVRCRRRGDDIFILCPSAVRFV